MKKILKLLILPIFAVAIMLAATSTVRASGNDTTPPVISGQQQFTTYVGNPISRAEIISHLTAYDDVDGDLTDSIVWVNNVRDAFVFALFERENYGEIDISDFGGLSTLLDAFDNDTLESFQYEIEPDVILSRSVSEYMWQTQTAPWIYDETTAELNYGTHGSYELRFYVVDSSDNGAIYTVDIHVEKNPGGFDPNNWVRGIESGRDSNYVYYHGNIPLFDGEIVLIFFDPSKDYEFKAPTPEGEFIPVPEDTIGLIMEHQTNPQTGTTNYALRFYPSMLGIAVEFSAKNLSAWQQIVEIRAPYDDTLAPTFDNQNTNFITNVDNPITVTDLKALLKAYDDVDGDISHKIQVANDGYTNKRGTVGVSYITFIVSDTAGNDAMIVVAVHQMDVVAPTYDTSVPLTVYYRADETFDAQAHFNSLNFQDNHDSYGALSKSIQDGYIANKTVVGSYDVIYEVVDTSGNKTTVTVTVVVTDATPPVITGLSTFTKNNNVSIKAEDLIQYLTAIDAVDGDLSDEIYILIDNYKDTKTPGQYTVTYAAKDSSGNVGTLIVTIIVVDVIKPVMYITDGNFFTIDEINAMTLEDIINVLIATGQLDPGAQVTIESDSYTMNANTPGNYNITLSAKHGSETRSIDLFMNVVSSTPDEVIQGSWFREHLTEIILVSVAIGLITAIVIRRK